MDEQSVLNQVAEQPQEQQAQNQGMSQEMLNKIVGREKAAAREAGKKEAESQYQMELQKIRESQDQRNMQVSRDVDIDHVAQKVQENLNKEFERRNAEHQVSQIVNNYTSKVQSAKANYEDFDDVIKDYDPSQNPQLTYLLSGLDNAGDILYDLNKNPMKLASLTLLAERSPNHARSELTKLSQSIRDNRDAQSQAENMNVNDPLDRLAPSRVAQSDGKMSIRDLKNQSWLRG